LGKNKKNILLPKKPGPDKLIAAGILMNTGQFSGVKVIPMVPHERWQIEINGTPVGLNVNYQDIDWRSYTEVVVSQYNIPRTAEIQRLIKLADKNIHHRTEIGSFSDLINAFFSAQYWYKDKADNEFSDEKIVEEGIQCVSDLIQYGKLKLQRDDWSIEILQKEVQKVGAKKIPRLMKYLQQINAGMRVECDIIELLTTRKQLRGEEEAQKFAAKIVRIYAIANEVFQEAIQICRESTIVKETPRGKIVATRTDNPVFGGAANVWFKQQPAITIQQLQSGHVQIFFAPNIPESVSDDLTILLRGEDLKFSKRDEAALSRERESPEVPKWFYVKPPYGTIMILNASIRTGTESIAPTKIPLLSIVNFAELVLRA
jgi:hypothetical protein